MVTYSDLIQFVIMIIELITLCFIIFGNKNKK